MTPKEFFTTLEETNTLQKGHFIFASGRHGTEKIDFDFLLAHAEYCRTIGALLAEKIAPYDFDYLMGPGVNGALIAAFTAAALFERGRSIPYGHAQKDGMGGFKTDEPHKSSVRGKKVFLVDDVLTRGTTFVKVQNLLGALGAEVSGAAAIFSRKQITSLPTIPLLSWFFEKEMLDYAPKECPVCNAPKNQNSSS